MRRSPDDVQRIVVAKGYLSRFEKEFPKYRGKVFEVE
jgi:hypothetical protein